ncbi:MAG: DNA polymerase III subunit gamma/tau [bacterium]|nr:DNA polymerase III subunit gamma/tau [bacterium]
MSYLVLARKYRPENFEDIVGQQHISQTLKNAIKSQHIAHAYLFSGPRGVGKTTAARILAKTVNCLAEDIEKSPCNECSICKDKKTLDILEIDGASNRGIDEIRDLRDNVKFAPTNCQYKIYIIDEVHMLTEAAFNALLKTLEEPPAHVIFIFATTELHKIPETILSRCQKFNFKLISISDIVNRLKFILTKEKITFDQEALFSIATASGGSMRDSLSLLDQIISYSPEYITKKETEFILGIIAEETIFKVVDNIISNKTKDLMLLIDNLLVNGFDLNQMMLQLREHYRSLMMLKVDKSLSEILNIIPEHLEKYTLQSNTFTLAKLTRDIKLINTAINEIKYTEYPRIICELYFTKLSQPYLSSYELLKKLEEIEITDNFSTPPNNIATPMSTAESEHPPPVQTKNNTLETSALPTKMTDSAIKEPIPPPQEKLDDSIKTNSENLKLKNKNNPESHNKITTPNLPPLNSIEESWEKVIKEVSAHKMYVATYLKQYKKLELRNNAILITFSSKFYADGISKNSKMLKQAVTKVTGQEIAILCKVDANIETPTDNNSNISEKKTTDTSKNDSIEQNSSTPALATPIMTPNDFGFSGDIEESIPIPKDLDNKEDIKDNKKPRYILDDINSNEPNIKKIIALFDGELLPPKE